MRKLRTDYGAIDIYRHYCKTTGNPRNLTQLEYSNITKKFYTKILDELIMKGIEFNFPQRLGNLRIRKVKRTPQLNRYGNVDKRYLAPNWGACKKLWATMYPGKSVTELKEIKNKPIIYHMNRHTDGYRHSWHWDKSTCIAKNSSGYSIEVVRTADRRLAKALQDEELHLDYSLY